MISEKIISCDITTSELYFISNKKLISLIWIRVVPKGISKVKDITSEHSHGGEQKNWWDVSIDTLWDNTTATENCKLHTYRNKASAHVCIGDTESWFTDSLQGHTHTSIENQE